MIELTVTVFEREGCLYGIGEIGAPTRKLISNCDNRFVFSRLNTRVHVLAVAPGVTEDIARQFAIRMYEGKTIRVDLQRIYDTGIAPLPNGEHLTT